MPLGSLTKGDDWKFVITILNSAGGAVDVTGGKVWVTFKSKLTQGDPDSSAVFQVKDLDIQLVAGGNQPTLGIAILTAAWNSVGTLPPANTEVAPGSYVYDIQYQDTADAISTIEAGSVSIVADVTRDPVV